MQNEDTVSLGNIRLIKSAHNWKPWVQLQAETSSVRFNMTGFNDHEFICENKTHDFPTLIKYWISDNKLYALVSGDDMIISFEFERLKK